MVTAVIIVPAVRAFVIISLSQQVDNADHTGGNGCIFHGSDRQVNQEPVEGYSYVHQPGIGGGVGVVHGSVTGGFYNRQDGTA